LPGVELAGYLDAAVGVGEAARRYLEALRSVGMPVLDRDVPLPDRAAAMVELPPGRRPAVQDVAFNLLCMNPEQLVPYLYSHDAPRRTGRTTIGVWSWEVDVVPPGWAAAADEVAEVWTYSRFTARLIESSIGVPVVGVPPPLSAMARPDPPASRLPEGFRVLVMFDYLSTLERKNPAGAIDAYQRAFRPDDGAVLIVKSVNGQHRPERGTELAGLAGGRRDIVFVDQVMSAAERDGLVAGCDCYLSLHRSEGHGLPLAEAMAAGKPVVATAYGGNTEFMSDQNSYLVDWAPVPVGAGVEHYPAGARWAEPDVEHAARLLRGMREDVEGARCRVLRAQADVWALLSPVAVGRQMCAQLERLAGACGHGRRGSWRTRLRLPAGGNSA
jgi:glycosyltransferase involved in cell wall biosynthesis